MNLTINNIEHYKMNQFKELLTLSSTNDEWIFTSNTIEYINNGNVEKIYTYDDNGNLIRYSNIKNETIEIWKYNDRNQMIYHCTPNGEITIWEYNEDGNLTYRKHSNGYEEWWMFENGKKVHYSNSKFQYKDWKYNEYGQILEFTDSFGWKTENVYDGDIILSSYTYKNNILETTILYSDGVKCFEHIYFSGETNWYDKRGSIIHSEIINTDDSLLVLPEIIHDGDRTLTCRYKKCLLTCIYDTAFNNSHIGWEYDKNGHRIKRSRYSPKQIVTKLYDNETGKLISQEILTRDVCKRYDADNKLISYSKIRND